MPSSIAKKFLCSAVLLAWIAFSNHCILADAFALEYHSQGDRQQGGFNRCDEQRSTDDNWPSPDSDRQGRGENSNHNCAQNSCNEPAILSTSVLGKLLHQVFLPHSFAVIRFEPGTHSYKSQSSRYFSQQYESDHHSQKQLTAFYVIPNAPPPAS